LLTGVTKVVQVKKLKMKLEKNKFYIENITLKTFMILNVQFSKKNLVS